MFISDFRRIPDEEDEAETEGEKNEGTTQEVTS